MLKKNFQKIYENRKEITEQDLKKIRIMYRTVPFRTDGTVVHG